jgi:four helix bundle protein
MKFLGYSKGSAGEVRSMLYVALDLNYISDQCFKINYDHAINIITQISNFKKYLRKYAVKEKLNKIKSFIAALIKL